MSLATRCAACGTVFRVVQDQLKVSEGWVRCGKCNEVFNALDGLFDLQREVPPDWTPSQRGTAELQPLGAEPDAQRRAAPTGSGAQHVAAVDSGHGDTAAVTDSTPDTAQDTAQDTQADSRHDSRQGSWQDPTPLEDRDEAWPSELPNERTASSSLLEFATSDLPEENPAFLRRAERAARWQARPVRLALLAAAAGAGVLLAAQLTVHHRDAIAAAWPEARPLLVGLCEAVACQLEPLRRLEGWAVESSSLSSMDNSALYRLQVTLRNRDKPALMVPALDVTLTDNRGAVVARKVLAGKDLGEALPLQLAGGAELNLQSLLDAGDQRISGYSVEIFYP